MPGITHAWADIMMAAARVGGSSFLLLIITVSFLPVFVQAAKAGRLFKPPRLHQDLRDDGRRVPLHHHHPGPDVLLHHRAGAPQELGILAPPRTGPCSCPATALFIIASGMPHLEHFRWWIAGGWAVLMAMFRPAEDHPRAAQPDQPVLQRIYEPAFRLAMARPLATASLARRAASDLLPDDAHGHRVHAAAGRGATCSTCRPPTLHQHHQEQRTPAADRQAHQDFPRGAERHGKISRAATATTSPALDDRDGRQLNPTVPSGGRAPSTSSVRGRSENQKPFHGTFWPAERPITTEELKFGWSDPDGRCTRDSTPVVAFPAWPTPGGRSRSRTASTCSPPASRRPVGIKILGPTSRCSATSRSEPPTRSADHSGTVSAYPGAHLGGNYVDFDIDRAAAATGSRLTTGDVRDVIQSAVGGMNITTDCRGLDVTRSTCGTSATTATTSPH